MKHIYNLFSAALLILLCQAANAQSAKIVSGFRGIQQLTVQLAMVIGPIAFIVAGLIYYKNKQEGNDKLSGAFMGTIIIGASTIIFTTIYSLFN